MPRLPLTLLLCCAGCHALLPLGTLPPDGAGAPDLPGDGDRGPDLSTDAPKGQDGPAASPVGWAAAIGGSEDDVLTAVAVDGQGNVYVTGSFSGTAAVGPPGNPPTVKSSAGTIDALVASYTSQGALRWVKTFGGAKSDSGASIAAHGTKVYVTGSFSGTASLERSDGTTLEINSVGGSNDIFVGELDGQTGDVHWLRGFGSAQDDSGRGVAVDSQGFVYVVGDIQEPVVFDGHPAAHVGAADLFCAAFDPGGTAQWATSHGKSSFDYAHGVAVGGGVVWMVGTVSSASLDLYAVGLDPATGQSMAPTVLTSAVGNQVAYGVAADGTNGTAYITGSFAGTMALDGQTATATSSGDVFVVAIDKSGAVQWLKGFGSGDPSLGLGVALGDGLVWITGSYSGLLSFDAARPPLTHHGSDDIFVVALDPATGLTGGEPLGWGSSGGDTARGIAYLPQGGVHLAGEFTGAVVFDSTLQLKPIGTSVDGFVMRYSP